MVDGTELIAEAGEEVHQEDRVARERADALTQLQTPGAREDHAPRPVTELPADLPSLITRLREEGSQLGDESVIPENIGMQEPPGLESATVLSDAAVGTGAAIKLSPVASLGTNWGVRVVWGRVHAADNVAHKKGLLIRGVAGGPCSG